MNNALAQIKLSPLDKERFGIESARVGFVSCETLPSVMQFCYENRVKFLIARCPVTDLAVVQAMEQIGFRLMDTLVYYARDLKKTPLPTNSSPIRVRPLRAEDEEEVQAIAAASFKGYFGHYHADPRLDKAKCDEAYISWAIRSCTSREAAEEVLVAELEERIVGFGTLRLNNPQEGEGLLYAVHPAAQRLGVNRAVMIGSLEWCSSQGAQTMLISTQLQNIGSQKTWARVGFEMHQAYYTFHKWFD